MLPPFIIEQIRKREGQEERRRQADQPRLEIPLDMPVPPHERKRPEGTDDVDRGVVILDLG
jgi:hypothetical protein